MNRIKKEEHEEQVKICKYDLMDKLWLNLEGNFSQQGALRHKEPTFEIPSDSKKIDWSAPQFNTPRTMTIKNIRDIFFSLMN